MKRKERERWIDEFEELVDQVVQGREPFGGSIENKMDLLERAIEQWRIERFKLVNEVPMEQFLDTGCMTEKGRLHFYELEDRYNYGTGATPLQLQRRLIVHLLLDHGQTGSVFGVIESFIARIHKELHPVDFKRTSTGVLRCYTNSRFAALKLRDAGLLRFTQEEAFKRWVLTLPGFVVAARSFSAPLPSIGNSDQIGGLGLDKFIHECQEAVQTYPAFVNVLASLCAANADVFTSFKPTLERCHYHLRRYWEVLNDVNLKSADVIERSTEFIRLIDRTEGYGRFIEEFSASIQFDRLVADLKREA